MPQQINRVPPGLLSLLGIKSVGQNPALLSELLQPTVELLDLYTEAAIESVTATVGNVNTTGSWNFVTSGTRMRPNPGELWIVRRMTVVPTINLNAGTSYGYIAGVINSTNGGLHGVLGVHASGGPGTRPACGTEVPFIIGPASELTLWVESLTLGIANDFGCNAQITRLQI